MSVKWLKLIDMSVLNSVLKFEYDVVIISQVMANPVVLVIFGRACPVLDEIRDIF